MKLRWKKRHYYKERKKFFSRKTEQSPLLTFTHLEYWDAKSKEWKMLSIEHEYLDIDKENPEDHICFGTL